MCLGAVSVDPDLRYEFTLREYAFKLLNTKTISLAMHVTSKKEELTAAYAIYSPCESLNRFFLRSMMDSVPSGFHLPMSPV